MKSVFFYGLFMDVLLLRQKGLNPNSEQMAFVENFALRIGHRATLVPKPKGRSYGMVMKLADEELECLYREPTVCDYIPEIVRVLCLNGGSLDACVYNLPFEKITGSNKNYAISLVKVAEKIGLPGEYVNEIKGWIKN